MIIKSALSIYNRYIPGNNNELNTDTDTLYINKTSRHWFKSIDKKRYIAINGMSQTESISHILMSDNHKHFEKIVFYPYNNKNSYSNIKYV